MAGSFAPLENLLDQEKTLGWIWTVSDRRIDLLSPFSCLEGDESAPWALTLEEWLGQVHPDDRNNLDDLLAEILNGSRRCYETEFRFRFGDGPWRWLNVRGKITVSDRRDLPLKVAGIIVDVTERHVIEDSLRMAMDKFLNCFRSGLNLRCLHRAGVVVDVNDLFLAKTGYAREELLGLSLADCPFFADRRKALFLAEKSGSAPSLPPMETALLTRSGKAIPCLCTSAVCSFGTEPHILTEFSDISCVKETEELRRRLEKDLLRDKDRLQLVQKATGDALWDWDLVEGRLFWSDETARWLGWDAEDLQGEGRWLLQTCHPDDRQRLIEALRAHFQGRTELFQERFRLQAAWGTWTWILARGQVLARSPSGRPLRFVGTLQNVTDLMAAEERRFLQEEDLRQHCESDPLTGIRSEWAFRRDLHREVARAHRYGTPLSLTLLSLDILEETSLKVGPAAERQQICRAAAFLEGHLRQSDLLARWKERHFVILSPQKSSQALKLAKKLNDLAKDELGTSLTCGVTGLSRGEEQETFLQRARMAHCQIRATGGDGVARV